jgi:hypothetical protein
MAEIVSNLFGIDPAALQQQQAGTDFAQAFRFAQLDPFERANMALYQSGAGIARGTGQLLGGDEQLNRATALRQLSTQFDLTTPEGLQQYATAAAQIDPRVATQAAAEAARRQQQSLTAQKTRLDIGKTEMDIKSTERKIAQDEKLRAELNTLPANATDEQILSVFRKYGDPNVVIRALEASSAKKAALIQKEAALDLKRYEQAKSDEAKVNTVTASADRIINTVDEAIPLVGYMSAGLAGGLNIPGTQGRNLEEALKTVKANLGFDRLQQMRDASKTGGALGQVAVKELEALQASIASLDRGQSPDVLKRNLEDIKFYYTRWSKAVRGEDPGPAVRPTKERAAGTGAAGTMSAEDDALINKWTSPQPQSK